MSGLPVRVELGEYEYRNIYFVLFRENIGEYNLSEFLQAPPPISEKPEPLKYTITEDVKKMQAAMQELFLQQKEKGGIIDLEAEKKKYLVVTNSATPQDEALAELSPTDYPPGKISSGAGSLLQFVF